ncbi:tetraprenyl-beta-curcumene synthase family protein [Geosporobacter ferrireducens]|uniref:Tetraprenyl-beta-curcumene synthase n=2 Tax=Geosporobacter ferrireducens TaxID=1424294 RepID=A0A1D8GQM4_9FIRM|nr:tetraprenyl-beta-curcumene synthase family protein [Geosporobacter ferrireducens]AOT73104.1 hypothetical protein Gferi_13160 [Geosporobacter ferrireducens]MTI57213.1 tetraprenyl-beta-curcumene synthase family protein [Geosporobacter ferrireducens]
MDQSKIIYTFVKDVFPVVKKELHFWQQKAAEASSNILSEQASASIGKKSFHAQGGSIYSLYGSSMDENLIKFIVALQTISDYLDNLCDRVGVEDVNAFLQLHCAITDALHREEDYKDYYAFYPYEEDGGYLQRLVSTCKEYIRTLPSYPLVQEEVLYLGGLYSEMQAYKHTSLSVREKHMQLWSKPHLIKYPELSTWEFSAAAGSTLGIFMLCTLARNPDLTKNKVTQVMDAYFPWVCGLHILLDYFIDLQEDSSTGDLNFVSYYENFHHKRQRLLWFLHQSMDKISTLDYPLFHLTVIEGLLSMYLSDPKTSLPEESLLSKQLLRAAPPSATMYYYICKILRRNNII